MATSLQKQLANIAANSTHQLDLKAQKTRHSKSLLYEPRDAASQNFDTIFQICYEGFTELCALDSRCTPYARNIFSEQSKNEDRTQMTRKENEELDNVLVDFLGLMGGRLLLKPAIKAVEWLVRRFRVQEYNTEAVLLTFLPYHTSHIFPTLMSILPEQLPPSFRFLQPYRAALENPPRNAILSAAVGNENFFSAFNQYVLQVAEAKHHSAILLGFWASITAQAINGMIDTSRSGRDSIRKQREEDLLLRVLPILQSALSVKGIPELYLGACMIITILATKASLEDKALGAMMEAIVGSWTEDTLAEGMMCLSVVAEERQQLALPMTVTKAVLQNEDCLGELYALSQSQKVSKLAAGLAIGGIHLAYKRDATILSTVKILVGKELLSGAHMVAVLEKYVSTLVKPRKSNDQGEVEQSIFRFLQSYTEYPKEFEWLQQAAIAAKTTLPALQLAPQGIAKNDEMDVDDSAADVAVKISGEMDLQSEFEQILESLPTLPEGKTLLNRDLDPDVFQQYRHAFQLSLSSQATTLQFFNSSKFKSEISTGSRSQLPPLLIRLWSSASTTRAKASAIYAIKDLLESSNPSEDSLDAQYLLPYLVAALADPAASVRSAAAELCRTISSIHARGAGKTFSQDTYERDRMFAHMYGSASNVSELAKIDSDTFLDRAIMPALEDAVLDKNYMVQHTADLLDEKREAKSGRLGRTFRASICSLLASHLITPVLRVKLVLMRILDGCGKIASPARAQHILPFVRHYLEQPAAELQMKCDAEALQVSEMDKAALDSLTHRSEDEMQLLKDAATASSGSRKDIVSLAFERLGQLFSVAKGSQIELAEWLLSLSMTSADGTSPQCKAEALQTLRNLSLPTEVLVHLLETMPKAADLQEQPTTKKRRTSGNDSSQAREIDQAKLQILIQNFTQVLALVEMNNPEQHPQLLRGLFHCLSELHHFKTLLDSELVYTFQVLLGCILAVVDGLRTAPNADVDRTVIRTDLIVECVRTTSSTQIHNTALLLVSSLAGWAPELVLHCVMPLFTFMSSTLLRQSDSFSAHVTDQTVERIVPPLAASLKKKGKDLVVGASELLLSFTAAFEHIPLHRRAALFRHLVETLGADETLFAVVAMLVERYGSDSHIGPFVADLTNHSSGLTGIKAAKQYLNLVSDSLKPKRHLSDILLSFADKNATERVESQATLLAGLATLLRNATLRGRLAKELGEDTQDSKAIQTSYASLLEHTMQLNRDNTVAALSGPTNALLLSVLGLMPTKDFIESSAQLMQAGSDQTRQQVFKALEARVTEAKANDAATRQIFLNVLPNCGVFLRADQPVATRHAAISCIDQICEKYGKTDRDAVLAVAQHVAGECALGSDDASLRIISILCLASMVEILGDDSIPILPNVLDMVLSYVKDVLNQRATKNRTQDQRLLAAAFAMLNAVLDHLPWMLADQYLDQALLLADEAALVEHSNDALDEFSGLVAKKIGAAQLFSAVQRTFSKAPISAGVDDGGIRYHLGVFHKAIQHHSKATITQNARVIFNILLEAFDLRRSQNSHSENHSLLSSGFDLVDKIALDVTLKLNDATFRPFFITLVEWATKEKHQADEQIPRLISVYSFAFTLFDQLKSIVTSYAGFLLENASDLLRTMSTSTPQEQKLMDLVLQTLSSSFNHDQDEFWQTPAHFDAVAIPLVDRLAQSKGKSSSTTSLLNQTVTNITDLAAVARSQEHLKTINAALLVHMRSRDASVRLVAVKAQRSLTERLGADWLQLLPEMLPTISELHEDDDGGVETETLRWAKEIEEVLGESLDPMLA